MSLKLVIFLVIMYLFIEADSRFEFTNVNCTSFNKKIIEFEYCYLKSVNRSYKYLSGRIKLNEVPFSKLTVNFIMWKRYNGYKPFLYNITMNACKFLDNPKSNPVAKFIFDSYKAYSNINHSCPFINDLFMEKLPVQIMNHRLTKILPFPEGEYLFEFRWIRVGNIFASIKVFFNLS